METVPADDRSRSDEPAPAPDRWRPSAKTAMLVTLATATGSIITPIIVAIIEKL
jgi:hypothetical protein